MPDNAILLENVVFSWGRREATVLDIERFNVSTGERVFLEGPSGSGKTTLLSLLGGVAVPDQGRLEVLGSDLPSLSGAGRDAHRADQVGVIFQLFNLLPYLSALENVLLPCRFSRIRRERALASATNLETAARRLLEHMELDSSLHARPAARLSVGQQQRVAAARALIGAPRLLIADEPTSALDTTTRRHFLELLFEETGKAGTTLLLVSHDPHLRQYFDRAVSLADINKAGSRRR